MWPLNLIPKIPVDYPLIAALQMVLFFFMVWVFFILHRRPTPVVQILAISPFVVLANVVCRLFYPSWIGATDVPMFAAFAFSYGSTIYYSFRVPAAYGNEQEPDVLDLWQTKALVLTGLVSVLLFVAYGMKLYGDKQESVASAMVAYQRGYTIAVKQQTTVEKVSQAGRDSIKHALNVQNAKDSLWRVYVKTNFEKQLAGIEAAKVAAKAAALKTARALRPQVLIINTARKEMSNSPAPKMNRDVKPLEPNPAPKPERGNKKRNKKTTASTESESDEIFALMPDEVLPSVTTEKDSSRYVRTSNYRP